MTALGSLFESLFEVVDGGGQHEFAPLLSFFFNSHNSIFEEIAKFRASRRVWANVMEERYGAETAAAKRLKFHT